MKWRYFIFMLAAIVFPVLTWAHEIRPAYLEIKEAENHSLQITWKQPLMGEFGLPLRPSISAGWMVDSLASISYTETYLIKRWQIPADHASLEKQVIRIEGLEKSITDVLVQVSLLNNVSFTYLIKPIQPFIQLSLLNPPPPPVWQYIQLGIDHIWSGFDHLLFVLGLILLVKKRSRLFWTITAFTIAHSITLALATLHIIKVSGAFTEAAIALSIVFLAVELLRHYRGINGFAYHYPYWVSFVFGLLHGLGFASALQDVGLPENNIPLALFLFNAGVEIGQLAFVFLMLLIMSAIKRFSFRWPVWVYKTPAYLIGTLSMYWFFERLMIIFQVG
jgi:hydrogenase/urease accessory protein HupE